MPEDTSNQPDPQETNPAQDGAGSGEAKAPRTFSEAQVSEIVARRVSKLRDKLREEVKSELAAEAEKAKMDAAQRAKAEADEWKAKYEQAEAARVRAERRATLAGKVTDPEYALFRAEQNPDKYLGEDGALDVDALLADYPILAPQGQPAAGGTPPATGANGSLGGKSSTIADLQGRLEKARNRAERVAILSEIQRLQKG